MRHRGCFKPRPTRRPHRYRLSGGTGIFHSDPHTLELGSHANPLLDSRLESNARSPERHSLCRAEHRMHDRVETAWIKRGTGRTVPLGHGLWQINGIGEVADACVGEGVAACTELGGELTAGEAGPALFVLHAEFAGVLDDSGFAVRQGFRVCR